VIPWSLALAALAGAPETDAVAGASLSLAPGVVLERVVGPPALSADGHTAVVARVTDTGSELVLLRQVDTTWSQAQVLVETHNPDRPALDPAGRRVAYVAGPVAALWLLDLETGARTQLTNTVTERAPGQPPAGWLPVPHAAPPRFVGDTLVWDAPDGPHTLVLP
jgi:hypothetical protein